MDTYTNLDFLVPCHELFVHNLHRIPLLGTAASSTPVTDAGTIFIDIILAITSARIIIAPAPAGLALVVLTTSPPCRARAWLSTVTLRVLDLVLLLVFAYS